MFDDDFGIPMNSESPSGRRMDARMWRSESRIPAELGFFEPSAFGNVRDSFSAPRNIANKLSFFEDVLFRSAFGGFFRVLLRVLSVLPVLPVLTVSVLPVEEVAQEFQNLRLTQPFLPVAKFEVKITPDRVDKANLPIRRSRPSESRGSLCRLKIQLNEI